MPLAGPLPYRLGGSGLPTGLSRFQTLIAILVKPVQTFENAVQQVLTQRAISSGQGFILDLIGKILDQPRAGATDALYRRYLSAKALVNRSTGKREELIKIARAIVGVSTGKIVVRCRQRASFILEIRDIPTDDATAVVLHTMLTKAAGIGVRVVVQWSSRPLSQTFRLDGGPGLDVGHLSRAIDRDGKV